MLVKVRRVPVKAGRVQVKVSGVLELRVCSAEAGPTQRQTDTTSHAAAIPVQAARFPTSLARLAAHTHRTKALRLCPHASGARLKLSRLPAVLLLALGVVAGHEVAVDLGRGLGRECGFEGRAAACG